MGIGRQAYLQKPWPKLAAVMKKTSPKKKKNKKEVGCSKNYDSSSRRS